MRLVIAMLACSAASMAQAQFRNNLMPQPAELRAGSGVLPLASPLAVDTPAWHDGRLQQAIDRAVRRFEMATGLPHAGPGNVADTHLIVRVKRAGEIVQSVNEDESYALKVTTDGAEIDASTDVGAMHGLQTLLQLIQPDGNGYALPVVEIHDQPRFRWRGLMVDCGRHFEPIDVLKRTLDGMAVVKLNVFHWHLTEDQGFRIESKVFPNLTLKGSDGLFYTQEQAREIVAYARERGIRVVPEFEMPGHSTAWLYAYPKLASGTAPDGIRRQFGVSNYAIDPTREETYTFIERFLREMSTIFPDEYVHIGGDETPAPDWKHNPRILVFMKRHDLKDNAALQAYFNTRLLAILKKLHKRMIGWDEVLTPGLPKDVAVQSWRGVASLNQGAKLGYDGILSQPYYLDGMRSAGDHYLADPAPSSSDLTAEQRKHILGGEVCMWGEHVYARTIDSRIWPRTAAIAERFWSAENVRDLDDMYRRLDPLSVELESVGLTHLQSEDAGLRELAATQDIAALRTFASAFEPVSFSERYQQQHTNQLTSLDRFVDAVRPDPPSRHWTELLTRRILADPLADSADREQLNAWFSHLSDAVPVVQRQMQSSPRLQEASTRAEQVAKLSRVAHEALVYLSSGNKPPAGWKQDAEQQIAEARKPSGMVRFTFLDSLQRLVDGVRE